MDLTAYSAGISLAQAASTKHAGLTDFALTAAAFRAASIAAAAMLLQHK